MTNVYYRLRRRDPLARFYVPALLLLGVLAWQRLEHALTPDEPAAKPKPAAYIRMQSGSTGATDRDSTSPRRGASTFSGCREARAAGYENIDSSDARYGEHMDGDQDGVACETVPTGRRSR